MRRSWASRACVVVWLGAGCSGARPPSEARPRATELAIAPPARTADALEAPVPSSEVVAPPGQGGVDDVPDPPEPDWVPSSTWEEPYAMAMLAKDCRWAPPRQFPGGAVHFLHCEDLSWGGGPADPCVDRAVGECGAACSDTCKQCPTACVSSCEACKNGCLGTACQRECGRTCAKCRKKCLDDQRACYEVCRDGWAACLEREQEAWDKGPCAKICPRFAACLASCRPAIPGDNWECNDKCRKLVRCAWAPTQCHTF